MLFAIIAVAGMPSRLVAYEDGWHAWEAYEGIQGVGSIVKDSPETTSWLHWNRDDGGESASFSVTYSNPTDRDRRVKYCNNQIVDEEIVDFGVAEDEEWHASAGTITSAGVYTPPAATNDAVTIECFVLDGDGGYQPEQVHREWGSQLKIFKVGVQVQPANTTVWEDDSTASHLWTKYADGSGLAAYKETGFWDNDGDYNDVAPGWDLPCSWTTRTEPGGGGQSIQGTINFTPKIEAAGMLELEGKGDGSNSAACSVTVNTMAAAGVAASETKSA
jgi:hypothetical protein